MAGMVIRCHKCGEPKRYPHECRTVAEIFPNTMRRIGEIAKGEQPKSTMHRAGIPYSAEELALAAKHPLIDIYHRELMEWAAKEIQRLTTLVNSQNP